MLEIVADLGRDGGTSDCRRDGQEVCVGRIRTVINLRKISVLVFMARVSVGPGGKGESD